MTEIFVDGQKYPVTVGGPDPRRAYRVVDLFEQELCDYTGSPFAVAVNSCTNALFLSLVWEWQFHRLDEKLWLPRNTYIGVLQSALNVGWDVEWIRAGWKWEFRYDLNPTRVIDSARLISPKAFEEGRFVCLSFHSAKQLPLGRGGAILTDNEEAAEYFRAARMDGRSPGDPGPPIFPGWHMPMPPDVAARGLDILSRWNDKGYSPPALPHEEYPDLSLWYP